MATTLEELEIKFKASFGDLDAKMGQLKNQLNGLDKAANKTQAAFSGLGRMLKTLATVYAGRALFNVGKESLAMANEVVESENLFKESMGNMSKAAREWSDSLRDTLGLNAYTLRKNAGTMNVMLQSMGIGEKKAYDMSIALTELSEDMASFYNLNPQDMYAKLQSGMTGQSMPLKQIGILIDDHTLKQYAAAAGIKTTSGELTQQEKVLARYASIMAQTSASQGDLARTIDSPANQLRVLENTVDQAKVALGRAAQTIQATLMPTLNRLASFALTAAQAIAYLAGGIGGLSGRNIAAELTTKKGAKATENLASKLKDAADGYKKAGGAARKAAKDANVGLKGFDEINKITEEQAKSGGGGGGGGLDEFPPLEGANEFLDGVETISEKVRELAEKIRETYEKIKPLLAGLGTAFATFKLTGNPYAALGVGLWAAGVTALFDEIDRLNEKRWSEAFGQIDIDYSEALTIVENNMRTKTSRLLDGIAGLREDTDKALQQYAAAVEYRKKVAVTLQLMTMTTGEQQFKAVLGDLTKDLKEKSRQVKTTITALIELLYKDDAIDLKEYTERRNDMQKRFNRLDELIENLQVNVTAMVDAALEDGEVDDSELGKIIEVLNTEAQGIADGVKDLKAYAYATIDGALEAGVISEEKADTERKKVDAYFTSLEAELGTYEATINATIGKVNWVEKTLTPEQLESYEKAVQAQADAAGVLTAKVEIQVNAIASAVLGDEYEGSATQAAFTNIFDGVKKRLEAEGEEIERLFVEAHRMGMTPELMAAVEETLNTQRDAMEKIANGGLTDRALWAKALSKADGLSKDGIDNLIKAQAEYTKSQEERLRDIGEGLTSPLWESLADGADPALVHAAIKEIEDAINADVVEMKSGAAINAAKTFMPDLSKAIASGKLNIVELTGYRDQIEEIFKGVDYSSLTDEAKAAALEMIVPFMTNIGPGGEMSRILSEGGVELGGLMETFGYDNMIRLGMAMEAGKLNMDDMNTLILYPTQEGLEQLAQKLEAGGEKGMAGLVREMKKYAPELSAEGASIANSLAAGFTGAIASAKNLEAARKAARNLTQAATGTMKTTAVISSPSKLTAWMGDMMVKGLTNSLYDGIADVSSISERLASAAIDGMAIDTSALDASPLSIASGSVSLEAGAGISGAIETGIARGVQSVMDALNINLNVDGQVLGRVAIKGINQATRAAGTMLLEF